MNDSSGPIDASSSEAAPEMLALVAQALAQLSSYGLPHSLKAAVPIAIAREMLAETHHPADGEKFYEYYHLQLGPRKIVKSYIEYKNEFWEKDFCRYETDLYALARALHEKGWVTCAERLLDASWPTSPNILERRTQILLCWQDDGHFLAIRDQRDGRCVLYELVDKELVFCGKPDTQPWLQYNKLNRTSARAAVRRSSTKLFEDEGQDELQWRHGTRLDPVFDRFMLEASDSVRAIGDEVGLAYAHWRFNDAIGDDLWNAVRVGNFAWENGTYFSQTREVLRAAPDSIRQALGLLHQLMAAGMSAAFTSGYGHAISSSEAVGVFLEGGQCLFVCADTNGDSGPAYRIHPRTGETTWIGLVDRFDWNFNTGKRVGGAVPAERIVGDLVYDAATGLYKS